MEINYEIVDVDNNLSQINELDQLNEEMEMIPDYENDKNWEDYFIFVEKKVQNAYNEDKDED